ncbi:thermonuclease family protein [Reyranella sp.]|uniref:thermonuclease family protein n=1 Tax=Reyranella sp. TaxID=1929291 RepID=UPI003C7C1F5A
MRVQLAAVGALGIGAMLVSLLASPLGAQSVTDGDTLRVDGTTYRLWGIDAPELKQDCPDGWPAGRLAATHLASLLAGRNVICQRRDTDRYGRTVAICRVGGEDLGALMVRDGFAWAFTRYSRYYVPEEAAARVGRAGVHGHDCITAWDWRATRRNGG